jgi:hypothetical protein
MAHIPETRSVSEKSPHILREKIISDESSLDGTTAFFGRKHS